MIDIASDSRFCSRCGAPLQLAAEDVTSPARPKCVTCGFVHYRGPALLVLALIFAEDRMLLIRRASPPYLGCWAPPGGFVESGESLEAAAVREVDEEVGIRIDRHKMLPHAVLSLPSLNQVCFCFLAMLERAMPLKPELSEVSEAAWVLETEYPTRDLWGPSVDFDIGLVFDRVRTGRFDFYQQTDDALRVISHATRIAYLWRRE